MSKAIIEFENGDVSEVPVEEKAYQVNDVAVVDSIVYNCVRVLEVKV